MTQTKLFTNIKFANNRVAPESKTSISPREKAFYESIVLRPRINNEQRSHLIAEAFATACETGERLLREGHAKGTFEYALANAFETLDGAKAARDGFTMSYARISLMTAFFTKLSNDYHDSSAVGHSLNQLLTYYLPK